MKNFDSSFFNIIEWNLQQLSNVFFVKNTEMRVEFQPFINLKTSCEFGKSFGYTHCLLQHPGDQKNRLQRNCGKNVQ